jgi:Bacterial PH domain
MQPLDPRNDLTQHDAGTPVFGVPPDPQETRVLPRVGMDVRATQIAAPPELAGMLLPTEHVTFGTSPHWIIFVAPIIRFVIIAIAFAIVLSWETHPIVRGHHVTVPLLTGYARLAVMIVGVLSLAQQVWGIVRRLFHYLGYRVVTTNRRVFIVEGILGRRVQPLGNTALAGARMTQGVLGRILGYGTIVLGAASAAPTSSGVFRDMRDPVQLYRECEAVALGVEGDTWAQPIRQTQIP